MQTNEIEANCLYEAMSKSMVILGLSCPAYLTIEVLQKLCDCIREHQTWNVAHIVAYVGLHTALENPAVQL